MKIYFSIALVILVLAYLLSTFGFTSTSFSSKMKSLKASLLQNICADDKISFNSPKINKTKWGWKNERKFKIN